jgi:hypothetical protein
MKRFSIVVREYGADRSVKWIAIPKTSSLLFPKRGCVTASRIHRYDQIRIVEHDEASTVPHISAE